MKNNYKFFSNVECEYFPCHGTDRPEEFNCLFCYCPLYLLGRDCGGNFQYVGPNGTIKDCSNCTLSHHPAYYDIILQRLREASQKQSGKTE